MSTNPRQQKNLKRLAVYILLLGVLALSAFFLNKIFTSSMPLFISPMGEAKTNLTLIEKSLKSNNILYSNVVLSGESYIVNVSNNGQVRLSSDKDINQQISSLQRILKELTIEGKSFKMIDFRFLEPIVSF